MPNGINAKTFLKKASKKTLNSFSCHFLSACSLEYYPASPIDKQLTAMCLTSCE